MEVSASTTVTVNVEAVMLALASCLGSFLKHTAMVDIQTQYGTAAKHYDLMVVVGKTDKSVLLYSLGYIDTISLTNLI